MAKRLVARHLEELQAPSGPSDSGVSAISAIREDLEFLKKAWQRIKAIIGDTEAEEIRSESGRLGLRDLRDLAYKIDDLLDSYEYDKMAREVEGIGHENHGADVSRERKRSGGEDELDACGADPAICQRSAWTELASDNSSGDNVSKLGKWKRSGGEDPLDDPSYRSELAASIRKIMEEISGQNNALKLRDGDVVWKQKGPFRYDQYTASALQQTGSLPTDPVFCGREEELPQLVQMLLNPSDACRLDGLDVIAVVGMGGVGKTTLAQKAYNHPDVSKQFATTRWVCVSEHFDVLKLTKEVAQTFGKSDCSGSQQLETVQNALVDAVRGKKFLLVMDDVWNDQIQLWDAFWAPLRYGAKGSKILITTRNQPVADSASAAKSLPLQHLSDEDGMRLFKQHAFFNRTERPELVRIGSEIVRKCKGLPLAIKVLARLLYQRPSNEPEYEEEKRWRSVLASDLWDMENKECGGQILGPLLLSYLRLPAHLRPLFASCSMFPKDYDILKSDLVSIWIENGLIEDDDEERSRETGLGYIENLTSRSLLQPGGNNVKMHDLIHDLAQYVCGEEHHSTDIFEPRDWRVPAHARHLYIDVEDITPDVIQSLACQMPNRLRTLFCSGGTEQEREVRVPRIEKLQWLRLLYLRYDGYRVEFATDFFDNAKHLRLIDLSDTSIKELPESVYRLHNLQQLDLSYTPVSHLSDAIGNLKSLRYLNLSATGIEELPESIGNLASLRHLNLSMTKIQELPESIGNLASLRHLDLSYTKIQELPDSIGELQNLDVLILECCEQLDELPKSIVNLINLSALDIGGCHRVSYLPAGINRLTKLERLPIFPVGNTAEGHAAITELKDLKCLRDATLEIRCLCKVATKADAECTILVHHSSLQILHLDWEREFYSDVEEEDREVAETFKDSVEEVQYDDEKKADTEEAVLQCLKPHTNLSGLGIYRYGGARVSSWIGDPSFTNLSHLSLNGFQRCAILPPLSQLPSLSVLKVNNMPLLEKVDSEQAHFPELQELQIYNCPKLICLSLSAPSLTTFYLHGCGSLTSISLFVSSALARLNISECSTLKGIKIEPVCVPSPKPPLKSVRLYEYRPKPPLFKLELDHCDSLESIPLYKYPPKLPLFKLELDHCDSLESIPLYEYPTLGDLHVRRCNNMERLDFGVHLLFGQPLFTYSLKHLRIDHCPRLSFTPTTQLPSSMEKLSVIGSPSLEEWCRRYRDTKLANIMYVEE